MERGARGGAHHRPLTQMADTGPEARSFHAMAYDNDEVAIVMRLPKITCALGEQFHAQLLAR